MTSLRRFIRSQVDEWRPSAVTLGAPAFPLLVLLGLNAVDELDRAAFAVLLPDIRDHFGLTDAAALGLVAATTIAVLLIEIPLSFYADRRNRVRIAATGAALWTLFSVGTGAAMSVAMLTVMRVGAGGGRAVVTPTHSSLLSDWYSPHARLKVFAAHRQASSIGQVVGPLLAGALAAWFGWRTPFFLFAVPSAVFIVLALRLREPARGAHEQPARAAPAGDADTGAWQTMRLLSRIRTIRRIWMAAPFLGVALFGVPNLLALIYEDVFDLSAAQRGLIAAGVEPLQIVGVFVGVPIVARRTFGRPAFLLRFVAAVAAVDGLLLVALAFTPHVAAAITIHALVAASIGLLAPAFMALVSLLAPAHVRSAAFTTMSVFAIPGIALFLPLIGAVSDAAGVQVSMLVLVPISLAAGVLLGSAARHVAGDIAAATAAPLPSAPDRVAETAAV